ncbi:MAG: class I tRNA ligase family protein, partial [Candidatus Bathyarchaeia archaeon]
GLLLAAEGMDDPDWRSENLRDVRNKLQAFYALADNIIETAQEGTAGLLEQWLISTLQQRIKTVTENIEVMKTRTAAENALFEIWNDIRWYTRRKGTAESKILNEALDIWTRLLAPFTPHLCEEVWSRMGKEGFLSQARWPMYDERRVNIQAEEAEALVKNVLDDTSNILRAIKIVPKKIYYYTAAPWKWRVYLESLEKSVDTKLSYSDHVKELMKDQSLKKIAGEVAEFLRRIIDEINRMPQSQKRRQLQVEALEEHRMLKEAEDFFEREFSAEVSAYQQDDPQRYDPKKKAGLATPYRPAIYIE